VSRRNWLRAIYGLGWLTYTLYAVWFGFVAMPAFLKSVRPAPPFPPGFSAFFAICGFGGYLQLAAPLAFLTFRPMWWGKLVMVLFCLSAFLTAPMLLIIRELQVPADFRAMFSVAAACSGVMFVLAIAQQIVDPVWWRPVREWGGNYPPQRSRTA
jgi:hypothetical protein